MIVDGVYDGCLGVQVTSPPNFLWRELLCIGSDASCRVVISCFIVGSLILFLSVAVVAVVALFQGVRYSGFVL